MNERGPSRTVWNTLAALRGWAAMLSVSSPAGLRARLPRASWKLVLSSICAALAFAFALGAAMVAADAGLRFAGLWSGGYYADPGADVHRVFVAVAAVAWSIGFTALGALMAVLLLQPKSIRKRLAWFWLSLPALVVVMWLVLNLHGLWPIENPRGLHRECWPAFGHTCPNYPFIPEAWVRDRLFIVGLTAAFGLVFSLFFQTLGYTLLVMRVLLARCDEFSRHDVGSELPESQSSGSVPGR